MVKSWELAEDQAPVEQPQDDRWQLVDQTPLEDPDEFWRKLERERMANAVKYAEHTPDGRTSSAGARTPWQVLPSTAAQPGYGVTPAKNTSDAELERVGQDLSRAWYDTYGNNAALAGIAYNAGPGALNGWLNAYGDPRKGEISMDDFLALLPEGVENYARDVMSQMPGGVPRVSRADRAKAKTQQVAQAQPQDMAQAGARGEPPPTPPSIIQMPGELHLNDKIAPKVKPGAPRPLAPGEWLGNPDGSWSSEVTVNPRRDERLNGGRPTILPSMWVVDGKPVLASEDQAIEFAVQSGLKFKSFDDEKAGQKYAIDREKAWQNIQPKDAGKIEPLWDIKAPLAKDWDLVHFGGKPPEDTLFQRMFPGTMAQQRRDADQPTTFWEKAAEGYATQEGPVAASGLQGPLEFVKGATPGAASLLTGTAQGVAAFSQEGAFLPLDYQTAMTGWGQMTPVQRNAWRQRAQAELPADQQLAIQSIFQNLDRGMSPMQAITDPSAYTRGKPFRVQPTSENPVYKKATEIQEAIEKSPWFKPAPGYEQSPWRVMGEGFGSMLPAIGVSMVAPEAAPFLFYFSQAGQQVQDAVEKGANEGQIMQAAAIGGIGGLTDSVPIELLLGRVPIPGVGRIKVPLNQLGDALKVAGAIGLQAFAEGFQEYGQQWLQNLTAKYLYNPKQDLQEGTILSAVGGSGAGAIAKAFEMALARRGARPDFARLNPKDQRAAALAELLDPQPGGPRQEHFDRAALAQEQARAAAAPAAAPTTRVTPPPAGATGPTTVQTPSRTVTVDTEDPREPSGFNIEEEATPPETPAAPAAPSEQPPQQPTEARPYTGKVIEPTGPITTIVKRAPPRFGTTIDNDESTVLQNIRRLGGIRYVDANGEPTPEALTIANMLDQPLSKLKQRGIFNADERKGRWADDILAAFKANQWFEGTTRTGDSMNDLYYLIDQDISEGGYYHPTAAKRVREEAKTSENRAWYELQQRADQVGVPYDNKTKYDALAKAVDKATVAFQALQAKADRMGIYYHPSWDINDLNAVITEREAMQADNEDLVEPADRTEARLQQEETGRADETARALPGSETVAERVPGAVEGGKGREAEAQAPSPREGGESAREDAVQAPGAPEEQGVAPTEKIATGDRLQSQSGRELAPVPNIDATSDRKTGNTLRRVDQWLLDEARKEVAGNDYQSTLLQGLDADSLSQADRDTLNFMLFGQAEGPTRANFVTPPQQVKTEPGAVDAQGRPLPQTILPGMEGTTKQVAAAREQQGRGKVQPKAAQKKADEGLFGKPKEEEPKQEDLEGKERKPKAHRPKLTDIRKEREAREGHRKNIKTIFERDGRVIAVSKRDPNYRIVLTKGLENAPYRVTSFRGATPLGHRDYTNLGDGNLLNDATHEFVGHDIVDEKREGGKKVQLPKAQRPKAQRPKAPIFYSAIERAVETAKAEKLPGPYWLGIINKAPNVKPEEIKWSELDDWLKAQKGSITKQQVLDYIRSRDIEIREVHKVENPYTPENRNKMAQHLFQKNFDDLGPTDQRQVDREINTSDFGKVKHPIWVMAGPAKNYREIVMFLPPKVDEAERTRLEGEVAKANEAIKEFTDRYNVFLSSANNDEYMRLVDKRNEATNNLQNFNDQARKSTFIHHHWDEAGVLVYVRFDERTGPKGERVLHVAEIQSDWHQKGRKYGYKNEAELQRLKKAKDEAEAVYDALSKYEDDLTQKIWDNIGTKIDSSLPQAEWREAREEKDKRYKELTAAREEVEKDRQAAYEKFNAARQAHRSANQGSTFAVPNAPFKETTSWAGLGMKRVLRYAAENDYDMVSWDSGEVQTERYRTWLRKSVDEIAWTKRADGIHIVGNKDGAKVLETTEKQKMLEDAIGKAMADQIINDPNQSGTITGDDITVSDTGMAGFYDNILPTWLNRYVKKWGAKVGTINFQTALDSKYAGGPELTEEYLRQRINDPAFNQLSSGARMGIRTARRHADAGESQEEIASHLNHEGAEYLGGHFIDTPIMGPPVHVISVTPEMKQSVVQEGQPKWQRPRGTRPDYSERKTSEWQLGQKLDPKKLTAKQQAVVREVNKVLARIVPKAETTGVKWIKNDGELNYGLVIDPGGRSLLAWTLQDTREDTLHTARHEALHWLRANGLIPNWDVLKKAAEDGKWIEHHEIDTRYKDLDHEGQLEEAIAEQFAEWRKNRKGWPEPIHRVFNQIDLLLRRIAAAVRRVLGKQATVSDIFTAIETGRAGRGKEAARQEARTGRSQRPAPVFFSALERFVRENKQGSALPSEWKSMINNAQGLKREEINWSGVEPWLDTRNGRVKREELANFIKASDPEIEEKTYGEEEPEPPNIDLISQARGTRDMLNANYQVIELAWYERQLRDWLNAHPNATDIEYLTREYDLYRQEHNLPNVQPASIINELRRRRDARYDDTIEWLEDYQQRRERADIIAAAPQGWATVPRGPTGVLFASYQLPGGENYREITMRWPVEAQPGKPVFRGGHFPKENIIVHFRLNDRIDKDGKRVLFIEEIQSDWHQLGRDEGYKPTPQEMERAREAVSEFEPDINKLLKAHGFRDVGLGRAALAVEKHPVLSEFTDSERELVGKWLAASNHLKELIHRERGIGAPQGPFMQSYGELAMKRILRMAAEEGYDRVAWTTGDQQNERYPHKVKRVEAVQIAKKADTISWTPSVATGSFFYGNPTIVTDNQGKILKANAHDYGKKAVGKNIADVLGEDIAKQGIELQVARGKRKWLRDVDFEIGAEGMRGWYDKIMPAFYSRYAKKWGAKVGTTQLEDRVPRGFKVFHEAGGWFITNVSDNRDVAGKKFATRSDAVAFLAKIGNVPVTQGEVVHSLDVTDAMRQSVMQGQPKWHRAYHGSPHDFEKFSADKIGTGQGAQMKGWGLYFADTKGVAEYHRDTLAGGLRIPGAFDGKSLFKVRGDDVPEGQAGHAALDTVLEIESILEYVKNGYDQRMVDHLKQQIERRIGQFKKDYADEKYQRGAAYEHMKALADFYDKHIRGGITADDITKKPKGKLYTVDLAPKQDEYLDLDKPLGEQSEKIKSLLGPLRDQLEKTDQLDEYEDQMNADFDEWTGDELVQKIIPRMIVDDVVPSGVPEVDTAIEDGQDKKATSLYLKSLGIPGSRFLDQGSRWKIEAPPVEAEGHLFNVIGPNGGILWRTKTRAEAQAWMEKNQTHNFVIFDPELVTIEAKAQRPKTKAQRPRGPTGPVEASVNEDLDDAVAGIGNNLPPGGINEAAANVARQFPPDTGGGKDAVHFSKSIWGAVQRLYYFPQTLAEMDKRSARYWNALRARDREAATLLSKAAEGSQRYVALNEAQRKNLHAVEELMRLKGQTLRNDGNLIEGRNDHGVSEAEFARLPARIKVNRLTGFGIERPDAERIVQRIELGDPVTLARALDQMNPDMAHSSYGDMIRLDRATTDAYFERRELFKQRWTDLMKGVALSRGWKGSLDTRAIRDAAERARDAGDNAAANRLDGLAVTLDAMGSQQRTGYVPFQRFGDYYIWVQPKLGTGADRESLGGFPRTLHFQLVDTKPSLLKGTWTGTRVDESKVPAAAQAEIDKLRARYPEEGYEIGYGYVKPKQLAGIDIPALQKILIALNQTDPTLYEGMVAELEKKLYEELKAGFKRQAENIPGYDPDFARATGNYFHWTSNHIADLIHGERVRDAWENHIQNHPDPGTRQFWKKYTDDLKAPGYSMIRGIQALGFYWEMAGNLSSSVSMLLHGPQIATFTLGVGLGAKIFGKAGGIKASRFMGPAYAQAFTGMRADTHEGAKVTIDAIKGITPEERAALKEADKQGLLHSTEAGELRGMRQGGYDNRTKAGKFMGRVGTVAGSNISSIDRVNRISVWLAAYRMAQDMENLRGWQRVWSGNQIYKEEARLDRIAVAENPSDYTDRDRQIVAMGSPLPKSMARFMLEEGVGIWGKTNQPAIQRGVLAPIFQFRGFQMRALRSMYRNARMGTPGRVALLMMLIGLGLLSGFEGLPWMQDLITSLEGLATLAGEPDPMLESQIYDLMQDSYFNHTATDSILKGPARQYLGIDLSNRLGFGNIAPDLSVNTMAVLGPTASLFFNAYNQWSNRRLTGQTYGQWAPLMPAALRNPYTAFVVYPREGVRTAREDPDDFAVVEPQALTASDQAKRAIGYQPARVSEAYEDRLFWERLSEKARNESRVERIEEGRSPGRRRLTPEQRVPRNYRRPASPYMP